MNKSHIIFITIFFATSLFITGCKSTQITKPYTTDNKTGIITTDSGKIRGIHNSDNSVELFAGIPFAKPPVGNLRWKEPENLEPWDDVLEADHFAPVAMQSRHSKLYRFLFNQYIHSDGDRSDFGPMSEDCLYLNIWRPANPENESQKLPVLVYIHGGSLMSGSSWSENYDGESLTKKGIIVVTIAYRVGVFGYFAHEDLAAESPNHTTGNYGLLDQIKALEWINQNIGYFGGDADNITIAGESAGSSSVNALCASPLSKGLFRRAIGESSSLVVQVPPHTFRSQADAFKMGHNIMQEFKAKSIEDLRKIPAKKLIKTRYSNNAMTIDPYAMPEYPLEIYKAGKNHEEALLNGFNLDEGRAFTTLSSINLKNYKKLIEESPYVADAEGIYQLMPVKTNKDAKRLYTDVFSVVCFTYPHYSWTQVVTAQNRPVYEYCFVKENPSVSTMHSGEIIYAYGNLDKNTKKIYTDEDYTLSETMMNYWVNFAKFGDPNGNPQSPDYGKLLPYWEKATEKSGEQKLLQLGTEVKMTTDPFTPFYEYLITDF